MLYTNTAIESRGGTRAAILPVAVGLARGADDCSEGRNRLEAERAIDDVLADSFPASDPPSWNPGVSRPEPAAVPMRHQATWSEAIDARAMRAGVIDVSRPTLGARTYVDALVSLVGAAGIAWLVPLAILLIGVPIALTVRGLLEVSGWLFGIVAR
jgi:hypothetical protein